MKTTRVGPSGGPYVECVNSTLRQLYRERFKARGETMKHYRVLPCVNHLGNQTGWDICHPSEPDAPGVAVVATVFEGEDVARVMAQALDAHRIGPYRSQAEAWNDALEKAAQIVERYNASFADPECGGAPADIRALKRGEA